MFSSGVLKLSCKFREDGHSKTREYIIDNEIKSDGTSPKLLSQICYSERGRVQATHWRSHQLPSSAATTGRHGRQGLRQVLVAKATSETG
jgi:hypothetical protein